MSKLSEEFSSGGAILRIDVIGSQPIEHVLEDMTYLNYRLASVQVIPQITQQNPDIVWLRDDPKKSLQYKDGALELRGEWYEGELQKIVVALLALKMEITGLHPFHASAIRYCDRTIMFMGGEANHGKTMSQIEGSRRGGLIISTETTVADERGWAVMGSKNVFLRKRAKGTERSDIPSQDQGVAKFFDKTPEFITYDAPSNIDMVILPAIDGNYDTAVIDMIEFEKEYQTFHSLMNYLGPNLLLAPGLPMANCDTEELRMKRADFCHRFSQRPYRLIRAKNPQIIMDEVERL